MTGAAPLQHVAEASEFLNDGFSNPLSLDG